ncbi:MAG: aspartate-semialdehyde dehydrogenase [Pseudomonadota bacterium]
MTTIDADFRAQLEGYALATAEITYRMPDARSLLQTYVWQDYDIAPRFPKLKTFLGFWERELEGPIHSVRLSHASLLGPREVRMVAAEYQLH